MYITYRGFSALAVIITIGVIVALGFGYINLSEKTAIESPVLDPASSETQEHPAGEQGNVTATESNTVVKPAVTQDPGCIPVNPPAQLGLELFYTKYCLVEGIPLISSGAVSDGAFVQAAEIMRAMLKPVPSIKAKLIINNLKVAIIGTTETTTMMPEYSFLKDDHATDWDARARGLGATFAVPLSSGAEENLLCLKTDPYKGESILLHEFAHSMKTLGFEQEDNDFNAKVQAAYESALGKGLWTNTYAATNVEEYWAEGVQSYFDANISSDPADGIHNNIATREKLKTYDSALYELIADAYPTDWRWKCGF